MDEFNSKAVAWHFDIGNCVTYGWPEHWVRTLGKKHLFNLHIKEYSRDKSDKHCGSEQESLIDSVDELSGPV